MIARLDLWLGKYLFQPPIILLCQSTGMTQYALHRYLWWAVTLYLIWRLDSDSHWLWKSLLILVGITQTIGAGLSPDRAVTGSDWIRRFLVVMGLVELVTVSFGKPPSFHLLPMLFAEYALTIKTIPPREKKKAERVSRKVEA